ncbi:uncharacterized protein [Antedon mediterranea]|uniref:uncharacterized protein isoform X2 n=1 Tax=Antedon mediterranea TaxID=105859 RepID=UPI003AF6C9BF
MSSKAVAVAMNNGSMYQSADKTTMQRHGHCFLYLVGLFVCFATVWYVVKLKTEVSIMKTQLTDHTRQIDELRRMMLQERPYGMPDRNTDNQDLNNLEEETSNEIVEVSIEVGLDAEQEPDDIEGTHLTFKAFGGTEDDSEEEEGPFAQILHKIKRNVVDEEEPTESPGKKKNREGRRKSKDEKKKRNNNGEGDNSQEPTAKNCRRACKNNRVPPVGCGPCATKQTTNNHEHHHEHDHESHHEHKVGSVHFVGYTESVVSVDDEKNPDMASVDRPINEDMVEVDGLIPYWAYADWVDDSQKKMFHLSEFGNVTVSRAGIYFIYSQVQYYDENDFTGHSIMVDGEPFVSCTECPVNNYRKYSTCYVGGVIRLEKNAQVGINANYRTNIRLASDTSYFGFIKLV